MNLCCFYDCSVFITSISVIKNFIIIGDILKSVTFIVWIV